MVPRQNGKGSVLEARELAGLFLFGERLILHSAQQFKTASEAFRRILSLIEGSSDLSGRVLKVARAHGEEGIELRNGSRLKFVARSTGSGRGFSGDCVILDEAYDLSDNEMSALLPTLSARENPQIWYTSSAPLDDGRSEVLKRVMRRGRVGDPALAYLEWSADGGLDDVGSWADANPGLGIRIGVDTIESERAELTDTDFGRERLGIVSLDETPAGLMVDLDAWDRCRDPRSGPDDPVVFGVDVPPDRKTGSAVVAGRARGGGVHLEVVWRGPVEELVGTCARLCESWSGLLAVSAGSPASSFVPDLVAAGCEVVEVGTAEHSQACGAFVDAVRAGEVRHLGQPELESAVRSAVGRDYGDAWLWSRKKSGSDIAPVVAATLARWVLLKPPDDAPVFAF